MDTGPRYTLRVSQLLLDKINYVATFEGRTKNKHLEYLIRQDIARFEQEHGKIDLSESPFPE